MRVEKWKGTASLEPDKLKAPVRLTSPEWTVFKQKKL